MSHKNKNCFNASIVFHQENSSARIRHKQWNTPYSKELSNEVGSFTWNTFLFPGHFSVQAFLLTEIGPVP